MRQLWAEFQRRKVVRVAGAYAVAAFVVLQVADLALPALGAPGWVMGALVVLAGLGLIVAIALAWAFDITPQGIERAAPVAGSSRRSVLRPAAILGVVLVAAAGVAAIVLARRTTDDDGAQLDPDLLVVLPFRVSGDASIAYLRESMVDLLSIAFTGETGPRAADPRTVVSAWRRLVPSESADLPPDSAALLARRLGAGQVLLGTVSGNAAHLAITARILDSGRERRIAEASVSGPADSVQSLLDDLTAQLLSLGAGEAQPRMASLTSISLPALRAYLQGQQLFRRARFTSARVEFDRALQLDTTFALAAMGLRLTVGWGGQATLMMPRAAALLHQSRGRLSRADSLFADALIGPDPRLTRTYSEIIGAWERVVQVLPDRADAWFRYGDYLVHFGGLVDRADHVDAAEEAFRRALALDSAYAPAILHLMDNEYFFRKDTAAYRRHYQLLAGLSGTDAGVAPYQYFSRVLMSGDSAAIRAHVDGIDTLSIGLVESIAFEAVAGEHGATLDDAERALRTVRRRAVTPGERADANGWDFLVRLNMGQPAAAVAAAEENARAGDLILWHAEQIKAALYWDGDTAAARRSVAYLTSNLPARPATFEDRDAQCAIAQWRVWREETTALSAAATLEAPRPDGTPAALRHVFCAATVRAIHAALTRAPDAAAALARADSLGRVGITAVRFTRPLNFALARLHEERGDPAAALRAIRRHEYAINYIYGLSTYLRELGRLAALAGDRPAAISAYTDYLHMRERAEPHLAAQTNRVREELARLVGETR